MSLKYQYIMGDYLEARKKKLRENQDLQDENVDDDDDDSIPQEVVSASRIHYGILMSVQILLAIHYLPDEVFCYLIEGKDK